MTKQEICCPFDDGFCATKEKALHEYEAAHPNRLQRSIDYELYKRCPLSIQERARCARYRAYLEIQRQR